MGSQLKEEARLVWESENTVKMIPPLSPLLCTMDVFGKTLHKKTNAHMKY